MDQFICCFATKNHALLIDCDTLNFDPITLNMNHVTWVICDTNVHHALANSEYNTRRKECEIGAKIMGICSLREANLSMLQKFKNELPYSVSLRCHHVITENIRTLEAAKAMKKQEWNTLGQLMLASHRSLQDHYHVSSPELDYLVHTAMTLPGVYGARMTGGGFGGCTVNLVEEKYVNTFKKNITSLYQTQFGHPPNIHSSKPESGVRKIENLSFITA